MRRAALIYNPKSGRRREQRQGILQAAMDVLRASGVEAVALPTPGPNTAADVARRAMDDGADVIFACGGDGTAHEVAQAADDLRGRAVLGVVPLGTGNLLASELGLPRDPVAALRKQLEFVPQRLPLGRLDYTSRGRDARPLSRRFLITAGIGADAKLMYRVSAELKQRYGMLAYFLEMARLALIHRFPPFAARVTYADGRTRTAAISQVMVVRIRSLGPLPRPLPYEAQLADEHLAALLFHTRNPIVHGGYLSGALLGLHLPLPGVELVHARRIECEPLPQSDRRIYTEADGEFLGGLPAAVSVEPDAIDLLVPPGFGRGSVI